MLLSQRKHSVKKKEVQAPTEEIDFDAPLERQIKVGHTIHRQPYTLGLGDIGTVTPPRPLQQALHLYEPENKFLLPEKISMSSISLSSTMNVILGKI